MNIWIINHYAATPSQGMGIRHFEIARELVRKGHHSTIIGASVDHQTGRECRLDHGEHWKIEDHDAVDFLWIRTNEYKGNTWRRLLNMINFARRLKRISTITELRDPDVIIGSSPHLFTGSAALKLARKYQVPFILEIRDPWPQILTEIGNISPIHPVIVVMKIIERKLYKHADAIVGVWPGMGEYIAERGGKKEKFVWIPNGINPDSVGTISKPETKDRLTLVYAGSHGVANDLDIILDTAKLIREGGLGDKVLFKLIGDGPEKPRLKRRVEDERLPNILLLDRMSWKEIREHFQKADGFIMHIKPLMCFKYGNSPNKLFDYMSAGRPVLFSINSHYNIVERARAGFTVDPVNPHSMLEGIRKLIGAGIDERWAMGLRGRKYIEKHHDIRNLASRYEEVLIRTRDRYSA